MSLDTRTAASIADVKVWVALTNEQRASILRTIHAEIADFNANHRRSIHLHTDFTQELINKYRT